MRLIQKCEIIGILTFGIHRIHKLHYHANAETNEAPRKDYCISWLCGLFIPCFANLSNYELVLSKDVNNNTFDKSMTSRVFWTCLLIGPALFTITFCILGIWYDGWAYIGLTFYVFYVGINAWNRLRIRNLFGIDGNVCCDIFAHVLCCGAWAIAQERSQILEGEIKKSGKDSSLPNVELATS